MNEQKDQSHFDRCELKETAENFVAFCERYCRVRHEATGRDILNVEIAFPKTDRLGK